MNSLLFSGVLDLPWWSHVVVALVLTHVTIVAVTVFLHRHQAHHALHLHPAVSHFFRARLWLMTGNGDPQVGIGPLAAFSRQLRSYG